MSWRLMLFSSFLPPEIGPTAIHPDDQAAAKIIMPFWYDDMPLPDTEPVWIIGSTQKRAFFGRFGFLHNFLGAAHPAAFDAVHRPNRFFLGYTARLGAADPPPLEALEQIEAALPEHLEQLRNRTLEEMRFITDPPLVDLSFTAPRGETAWDKAVAAISRGWPADILVVNHSGAIRLVRAAAGGSDKPARHGRRPLRLPKLSLLRRRRPGKDNYDVR